MEPCEVYARYARWRGADLLNVVVIGAIWGMLRLQSGSILVSSVTHGLWNGLDYSLFGFGAKHGGL